MGLRGNNDMLATFFIVLCLTNTYRWYVKRDMKTIISLAFSFGLGMTAKISVGVIAVFTGAVMLYCLVKDIRRKEYKETIKQLAVFAVICIPLGMWYPIRNLILFNQPLNYVQKLPNDIPIYKGDIAWYKRFFDFNIAEILKTPFFYYPEGYSIPTNIVKTSMFAEANYENNMLMCSILIIVNIITIITAVVSMIYVAIKGKKTDKKIRFGAMAVWIILMASYVQFNIQYPHLCTADFRYIAVTVPLGAIFMCELINCTENKKIKNVIKTIMIAFAICVAAVYM
jgi:4-amino-4-deoxy-L-arabinose transferase-like glycosyltransferase